MGRGTMGFARYIMRATRAPGRLVLAMVGVAFVVHVSSGAEANTHPIAPLQTDWPTPRFDPEGTGFNPFESLISSANVGALQAAWSLEGAGPMGGTPLLVNGVVYASGQVEGTGTAVLYALEATTGDVLWTRTDGGWPIIGFTVAYGKIYAGFLSAHALRVYDAATGDFLWMMPGPNLSPTVVDGVVYMADNTHWLYAIDAESGHRLWRAPRVPFAGYGGVSVAEGIVYAGGQDADYTAPVYAYDADTGTLLWKHPTRGKVLGTPAVEGGTVFVGSGDHYLYALDANTGRLRWKALTAGVIGAPPAVANGTVFVGAATNLYAFNAGTGLAVWTATTGGNVTGTQAVATANGVVYVGSSDHKEYAFAADTGEQLWTFQTGSTVGKQSIVNGTLYVPSADSFLYAFRPSGF